MAAAAAGAHAQTPPAAPPSAASVPAPAVAALATPMTLATATSSALATNPSARASGYQFEQAQAKLAQAQAQLRSQITFSSSVGVSNAAVIQPPPGNETFGIFANSINVPLAVGRRNRLAVDQATAQLDAARAQFDAARLTLSAQVSANYYDVLRKQALLLIAQDTEASAQRQLSDARKRFAAGDVPELDVLRAQGPVSTAEAARYAAENAVAIARQTLNATLGRTLDEAVGVAELAAPPVSPAVTLTAARDQARQNNPDVRAALATVHADEIARRVAGLSREPVYGLQASDVRSNDQTGFSRLDNVQATVTIPLSDGGLAKAQAREADAALLQARAQADTAGRTAEATASAAYLNLQSSVRQIAAADTARQIATTAYDKTRQGYESGLFPLSDVLNAQSALTQARIAYTQALYDAAVATVTLNNSLGILPQ
jgi:outer membrane protein TolC